MEVSRVRIRVRKVLYVMLASTPLICVLDMLDVLLDSGVATSTVSVGL